MKKFIGVNAMQSSKSGMENVIVANAPKYTYEEVLNKKVRFVNGNIGTIVGGAENALLTEWENGNVSGFAQLKDIIEIIK